MIAVLLQGGLGNQMFQYAAGRTLAARRGVPLVLSRAALSSPARGETPRPYELNRFRIEARLAHASEEREIAIACHLGGVTRWLGRWKVRRERSPRYDPAVLDSADGTLLRGYWQSEKYFSDCAERIGRELELAQPLPAAHAALRERMRETASVSLHVRRGDYVTSRTAAAFHGELPMDYYQRAIDRIRDVVAAPSFFIFSDDPAWCREHLDIPGCEVFHVSAELRSDGAQDLALMRGCRHHIIANSSFSWWGAWLAGVGQPEHGQVIAPRQWFAHADDHDSIADRFSPHWTLL